MPSPLPHSYASEIGVLASVLLRNEALADVAGVVDAKAFHVPAHRAIYEAMVRLSEAGTPIDPVTLEYELSRADQLGLVGGLAGLGSLVDGHATGLNATAYARQVAEAASIRAVVEFGRSLSDESTSAIGDAKQWVAEKVAKFNELTLARDSSDDMPRLGSRVHAAFTEITERAKRKATVTGIPTGFTDLDNLTSGFQVGDLVLLAARPAMGKTAMALNFLRHACVPRYPDEASVSACVPSPIFSLEMPTSQLIERMLCDAATLDSQKLRVGRIIDSEFRELVRHADLIHRAPIWIDDRGGQRIDDMARKVSRLRRRGLIRKDQPFLAIVDYLQLCRGTKKRYDSREQEISEISGGLKVLAKNEGGTVLALAQLSRDVDKRPDHTPQLSDLRESGSLEQDADTILFLVRRERYCTDEDERKKIANQAELIVGKQRKGATGVVRLVYRSNCTRFENAAADDVFDGGM